MNLSKTLLILFFAFGFLNCSKEENTLTENIQKLEDLKKSTVPDKRVALFQYVVNSNNGKKSIDIETDQLQLKSEVDAFPSTNEVQINWRFLPDSVFSETPYGIIRNSVANIRGNPAYSAEQVTQALFGTPVKILKKKGGWLYIQTPEKYLGWAESQIIQRLTKKEYQDWLSSEKLIVTEETPVFSKANSSSLIAKHVVIGSILEINGNPTQKFIQVSIDGNQTGFISTNSVQSVSSWLKKRKYSVDSIVETSKTLLGRPYMWGGTSTKAMDCSGFTKTTYFLNGFQLPRDASQQVFAGEQVSTNPEEFKTFQKGDFLFFGRRGTNGNRDKVVHVAIYLGDGRFINASGEIKIESLDKTHKDYNDYRFKSLLQARRLNPNKDTTFILPIEKAWANL